MDNERQLDIDQIQKMLGLPTGRLTEVTATQKAVIRPEKKDALMPHQEVVKVEGGIPVDTIYPMSYMGNVKTMEELDPKRGWDEAFTNGKTGVVDPELNKLALEKVASERGVSVDQLLTEQGNQISTKVSFEKAESEMEAKKAELELKLKEMQDQLLKLQEAQAAYNTARVNETKPQPQPESPKVDIASKFQTLAAKPKEAEAKDALSAAVENPLIVKLKQRLSLEEQPTHTEVIGGIKFTIGKPMPVLQPWILGKISNIGAEFGQNDVIMGNVVKQVVFCSCVQKLEGLPVLEALNLIKPEDLKDKAELGLFTAEILWSMVVGSHEGKLFTFDPEVVNRIFEVFNLHFKDKGLNKELGELVHRYVCPVEGCNQFLDMDFKESGYYCPVHAVNLTDFGPLRELKSLPLA